MAVAIVGLTVLLFLIGFEMILVLGVPSYLLKLAYFPHMPDVVLLQKMIGGMNHSTLMAIPFFILAAEIMASGQIAKRLAALVRALIGHRRGGIGNTTVATAMAFGSVSGSAAATVSAIGRLMYPQLRNAGYSERFSIGLIASSSETALLIPPSITMIIYAWLTGASITQMFAAGLVIGLVLGALFASFVVVVSIRDNVGVLDPVPARERWQAVGDALWALGMPVIILGGIYTGFFTATEAASISVVYAMVVEAFVYRELTWKKLIGIFEGAAITSCVIFFLIGMGSILAFFLTLFHVPTMIIGLVNAMGGELLIFLLLVNITLILAGMFLDPASAMLILVPTLFPAAVALGVDPIHFGMIVTLNIAMAMITPPFGLDLFVTSSALNKPIVRVIRGVLPFIAVNLIALVIVTAFPAVSTFLPRLIS